VTVNKRLDFGCDPGQNVDPGVLKRIILLQDVSIAKLYLR